MTDNELPAPTRRHVRRYRGEPTLGCREPKALPARTSSRSPAAVVRRQFGRDGEDARLKLQRKADAEQCVDEIRALPIGHEHAGDGLGRYGHGLTPSRTNWLHMQCGLRESAERRTRRVLRQQRMASNSNADQDNSGAVLSASASAMTCEPILRKVTRAARGDERLGARRVTMPRPRARRTRPLRSTVGQRRLRPGVRRSTSRATLALQPTQPSRSRRS